MNGFSYGLDPGSRTYAPTLDPVRERRAVRIIDHLVWTFAHHPGATVVLHTEDGEILGVMNGENVPQERVWDLTHAKDSVAD
jgi:hypothetical protein